MHFKIAPWSRGVQVTTWVSVIIILSVYLTTKLVGANRNLITNIVYVVVLVSLFILYTYGPKGYSISTDGIEIRRHIKSIMIPNKEIKAVKIVSKVELLNIFANGGVFSYWGKFKEPNGKIAMVYCTRLNDIVKIKTTTQIYYLSPEDPEGFVQSAHKCLDEINDKR